MKKVIIFFLIISLFFIIPQSVLAEGEDYRDPFSKYTVTEEENEKQLKEAIPFTLTGIISSEKTRIAIIKTADGTEFVRNWHTIGELRIIDIEEEGIYIRLNSDDVFMEIGGDISVPEK